MSSGTPHAEHSKVNQRALLANEFFDVTHAELIPIISDEATWYDFDYLEAADVASTIQSHYGIALDEATLALPFWELLDFLDAHRTQTDV